MNSVPLNIMLRFLNVDPTTARLPPVYGYQSHPLVPLRQALNPLLSRIIGLDEYIKIAKRDCHFPSEHGLTRDESASIYIYTMDWGEQSLFRVLNEMLRVRDRSVLVPWYGYLKLFDTALKKLPSVQGNLWRGINLDITKNFKENQELIWWAISSCSSSLRVVKQFLGSTSTLLMIEAKNGKSISLYSHFANENEVILGLGTRLRVKSDALGHTSLNVVHLLELTGDEGGMDLILPVSDIHLDKPSGKSSGYVQHLTSDVSHSPTNQAGQHKNPYVGDMKNGKKHGKGTYHFASGEKYTGDFVDDKYYGQGVFTWPDGKRYEGQFKEGKFNGKGTYQNADGEKYIGDFVDGNYHGQGVLIWPNGNRYEGQFKDDEKNGKGTLQHFSGEKYTGGFAGDKYHGQGVMTWPDGHRYEGQFKNGNMDGRGKMYRGNTLVKEGVWSNGNHIS